MEFVPVSGCIDILSCFPEAFLRNNNLVGFLTDQLGENIRQRQLRYQGFEIVPLIRMVELSILRAFFTRQNILSKDSIQLQDFIQKVLDFLFCKVKFCQQIFLCLAPFCKQVCLLRMILRIVGRVWQNRSRSVCPKDIDTSIHKVRCHTKGEISRLASQLKISNLRSIVFKRR